MCHRPAPHDRGGTLVVRVYRLGEEPRDEIATSTTPEERLRLVWELTARAWALTGRPAPGYARHAMPGTVRRPE